MNQLATYSYATMPAPMAAAGEPAAFRFLEYFTAQLHHHSTHRAYTRDVSAFLL